MTDTERDELASIIDETPPVEDGNKGLTDWVNRQNLAAADAILAAGWKSPAEHERGKREVWDEGWDERDNDCSEPYSPHRVNPYGKEPIA